MCPDEIYALVSCIETQTLVQLRGAHEKIKPEQTFMHTTTYTQRTLKAFLAGTVKQNAPPPPQKKKKKKT